MGASDPTAEPLAAAAARIRELEARAEQLERSHAVQGALFRIAETASAARDMPSFYAAIHSIVGELMYADNFYIALYDDRRSTINYPFYRDEVDDTVPDPSVWEPMGSGSAAGLTAYLLRTGEPMLLDHEDQSRIIAQGDAVIVGALNHDWMGAPLIADGRTLGAVVVQSYRADRTHTAADLELLTFVAQHIATALSRARAIEETRQRNEELALVNDIGAALASQLEFSAIVDLVGERIRSIFAVQTGSIALYDEATNRISLAYTIEDGERGEAADWELGPGLMSEVISTRRGLRLHSSAETEARGALTIGRADAESWLGVPILAGERVLGVI
ncbi:MAG TPA: GAF domain-containing protein, partial [Candidatus Limnocylindria bacterium]|nr:GAF domain-containing protein [Candidatus Limnocylindria bacterium]